MTHQVDPVKRNLIDEWQIFRGQVLGKLGVVEVVSWEDLQDPQKLNIALVNPERGQLLRSIGTHLSEPAAVGIERQVESWVREASWPIGAHNHLVATIDECEKDKISVKISRELDEMIREAREAISWKEAGILGPILEAALVLWQENSQEIKFRHIGRPVELGRPDELLVNLVSQHERDISLCIRRFSPTSFMQFSGWTILIEHLDEGIRFGLYESGIMPVLKVALKRINTTQGHRGAVIRPANNASLLETMKAHWGLTAHKYILSHPDEGVSYQSGKVEGAGAHIVTWHNPEGETIAMAAAILPQLKSSEEAEPILDGQLMIRIGQKKVVRSLRACSLFWQQTLETIGQSITNPDLRAD